VELAIQDILLQGNECFDFTGAKDSAGLTSILALAASGPIVEH